MSRLREYDWKKSLLFCLTAFLLTAGISLCGQSALLPAAGTLRALMICFLTCLAAEILLALPVGAKWVILLGGGIALSVCEIVSSGPVFAVIQLVKAVNLTLNGVPGMLTLYTDVAQAALCVVVSLLSVYLTHLQDLSLPCIFVAASGVLCFLYGEGRLELILPAFAGLLLMMANSGSLRLAAVPTAAVLTALALLLTPAEPLANPVMAKIAADIRDFVNDRLFFNEKRAAFTLETAGYKPEKKRLGGAVSPDDRLVMGVETDEILRLRGCAYDTYTGLDWYDSLSDERCRYDSSRLESLRKDIFGQALPITGQEELTEKQARVQMLWDGATTLFVPQRVRGVSAESDRMVLYFNAASELFITRNLAPGDAYSVTYVPLSPQSEQVKRLIGACADMRDERYDRIAEDYLKLPSHIQKEVREIAEKATRNCETPLEKALALQSYLQKNYKYSLDVKTPPDNVDFTAWFLLGEKKGYCTYFATAMTVLSRLCGLPARYVTGFVAVPDQSGKALVTADEAHAWTEIYFNGFGWLEFDATPIRNNDQTGEEPPRSTPTPKPTPTPSPAGEPAPTATPEPEDAPTAEPSPDPEDAQTPTPPPAMPTDTPAPQQPPMEREETGSFPWLPLLLVLLALALFLRFLWTEPLRAARRKPKQAAETLLRAILALLALRHVKRAPQETWRQFGPRADEALQGQGLPDVAPLTEAYAAQVYGRHPADPELFRQAYLACRRRASLPGRMRLALKRMFTRR